MRAWPTGRGEVAFQPNTQRDTKPVQRVYAALYRRSYGAFSERVIQKVDGHCMSKFDSTLTFGQITRLTLSAPGLTSLKQFRIQA